jgi:predicted XRE-type DNA-binding protein
MNLARALAMVERILDRAAGLLVAPRRGVRLQAFVDDEVRELIEHMTRSGLSQAQIAKLFGVTQPRISDLMRGKIVFALDALVNMAGAGLRVKLSVRKAGLILQ